MEDTLITFTTAKLAKEKGFILDDNNISFTVYRTNEKQSSRSILKSSYPNYKENYLNTKQFDLFYCYPTQSLLQKWLREVHKINVYCVPTEIDETKWYHNIASSFKVYTGTYEEVLKVGLQEGLKLIKWYYEAI